MYKGQSGGALDANGCASIATAGFIPEGIFAVPWTATHVFSRVKTKPTTSKVTLEFKSVTANGSLVTANGATCSFYYEYRRP